MTLPKYRSTISQMWVNERFCIETYLPSAGYWEDSVTTNAATVGPMPEAIEKIIDQQNYALAQ